MEFVVAITIGITFACALFLLLRRSVVKLVLGIALLSQAVNMLILTASGLQSGGLPFIGSESTELAATAADPIPQALILTAIVISFGVLAFTLAMVERADKTVGTDDLDQMDSTDA